MAASKWPEIKARFYEIEAMLKKGLAEHQIFKNLGIGKTTWESYKHKYPELKELLKKGRASNIKEVENALYKAATGFYYTAQEVIRIKDGPGKERIEVVQVTKFKPPDTASMIFFLKNRDKINWSDNPQMNEIKREELDLRKKDLEFKGW
jgi:hypothetical protein